MKSENHNKLFTSIPSHLKSFLSTESLVTLCLVLLSFCVVSFLLEIEINRIVWMIAVVPFFIVDFGIIRLLSYLNYGFELISLLIFSLLIFTFFIVPFLFFLTKFTFLFIKKRTFVHLIILILSLFVPLLVYWWTSVRIPVPPGWKLYSNHIGKKYSFNYPSTWKLTECGNGEIVLAKTPIKKCYFPLDAPKEYFDNLYFQVFQPSGMYINFDPWNVQYPDRLKNWASIFWSPDDIGGDRTYWGNYGPLAVDPKKYRDFYPSDQFSWKEGVTQSAALEVHKGKYYSVQIGLMSHLYKNDRILRWVINSFTQNY